MSRIRKRVGHVVWLLLVMFVACVGDEAIVEVPRTDCEALRNRFVDISLETALGSTDPSTLPEGELAKHRQNLSATYRSDWLNDCQFHRSPDWMSCALGATDKQALRACESLHGTAH